MDLDDTIAAIATPPGEGGIGIIRLSGPEAIPIARRVFRRSSGAKLNGAKSHTIHYGTICDSHGEAIDQVLISFFKAPKSYTAEDVVEISAHGGMHVLKKILNLLLAQGARHAQAGEFTRRAFLKGRIDLAQAEAVLDLIKAKSDRSLDVALQQLQGNLSSEIKRLKDELLTVYAHLEAYLDFPDEHLEVYSNSKLSGKLENSRKQLKNLIASFEQGEILREGALVVLVGRTNVGKSSLLNTLLCRDRAIVSEIPGTTRDVIEESVEINGLWIRLVDTAGFSASDDPLDKAGMERTKRYLENGNLFLWLVDGSEGCLAEDFEILKSLKGKKVIALVTKTDLPNQKEMTELHRALPSKTVLSISAKTGEGIDAIRKVISEAVLKEEFGSESVLITRLRHKRALVASLESIEKSIDSLRQRESLELVTLDLKQALDALRELVGEIYSEDLLDVIFKEFCIGK
ncbi:MAG: tRNA uridine-5-carboxymethylaminomethyl(34) synthesis GTPase MnmE [Omnitrophica bacterium RIFCSPLOWO2_01_FULL_50_24]|nr:MAG: tRNA uridine-5-carboxymethylaminomethyl(34) synthesis GTPase MnmE [Omnitrophica bacterium RIFCSPLOWO2_01_FULL_50_24]